MMMKKYLGIALVAASLSIASCSSSDDDASMNDGVVSTTTTDDDVDEDTSGDDDSEALSDSDNESDTDSGADNSSGSDDDSDSNSDSDIVIVEATRDYGNTTMGILAAQPDLTLMESAVISAEGDLDQTLFEDDRIKKWTVFAPNDTALEGVSLDRSELLLHIHAGFMSRDDLIGLVGTEPGLAMTGGESYVVTITEDDKLQIGGATIVQNGIVGDNGIVYKIDGVLQK